MSPLTVIKDIFMCGLLRLYFFLLALGSSFKIMQPLWYITK